jgi:hypothetical protein
VRFASIGLALVLVGCGPSVQSIYEGNVRFEHCYRLDLDREIAPSHRQACWSEWTSTYAYGQTRDKVEYARRRLRYLAAGETSPPSLDLTPRGDPLAPDSREPVAPRPLSVHAPPPTLETAPPPSRPAPPPSASAAPPQVQLPQRGCVDGCGATYTVCTEPCRGTTAEAPSRCVECERDYGSCVRRCFDR